MKHSMILATTLLLFSGPLQADISLIEFTAELLGKSTDGDTTTLTVAVTPTQELDILVTDLTEIRDGLEEKTVDDLIPPMTLKIEAFATSEGFTAREIEITDGAAVIEVRGQVTEKSEDPDSITVASLEFLVNENTTIKELANPSQRLTFDDVGVEDFVKVEAFPSGDDLVASTIKVGDPGERFARLAFEGIVTAIEPQLIMVAIDSVSAPIPVVLTPDTEVKGDLFVGAEVTVIGSLNSELMVVARKIIVKKLLHLAPSRVHLRLNDSRQIQIILEEVLSDDLELTIESSDPAIVAVDPVLVTIPAGEVSAFFTISSGDMAGQVMVSASSGDLSASAHVEVRDNGGGPPALAWHPPNLNIRMGQTRTVRLQLGQRASEETEVTFDLAEGPADLLTAIPGPISFLPGEKQREIELTAGAVGEGILVATLPGGESAELSIRVR